jgi:hypothetical protein
MNIFEIVYKLDCVICKCMSSMEIKRAEAIPTEDIRTISDEHFVTWVADLLAEIPRFNKLDLEYTTGRLYCLMAPCGHEAFDLKQVRKNTELEKKIRQLTKKIRQLTESIDVSGSP